MPKHILIADPQGTYDIGQRQKFARILCPLDLTPTSYQSLWYGIGMALAYEAELIILHCVQGGRRQSPDSLLRTITRTLTEQLTADHLAKLNYQSVIAEGDAVNMILAEADRRRADLIIMHSHRRAGLSGWIGSRVEAVYRHACCPVLVTHSYEKEWLDFIDFSIRLKRVLVGYDFSSYAELALAYAVLLAQEFQAELHLLHVLPPAVDTPQPLPVSLFARETEKRLHDAVHPEAYLWCNIVNVVKEGAPYDEILDYAEDNYVDLICVGAQGRERQKRSLFGSNTDRVLRQTHCPVFIARPLANR